MQEGAFRFFSHPPQSPPRGRFDLCLATLHPECQSCHGGNMECSVITILRHLYTSFTFHKKEWGLTWLSGYDSHVYVHVCVIYICAWQQCKAPVRVFFFFFLTQFTSFAHSWTCSDECKLLFIPLFLPLPHVTYHLEGEEDVMQQSN